MPVRKRRHSKTRRRYDVALGNTGAELRLPAMPQVKFSWRLVSGSLIAGLVVLLFYLWASPGYHVQAAEIVGAQRLNSQDVNLVLGVTNMSIFTLNPAQIQATLVGAFPEFYHVDVQVAWPNKVTITVDERQPILAWEQGNSTVWVDAAGIAFPPRGETDPLPTVMALGTLDSTIYPQQIAGEYEISTHQLLSPEMVSAILSVTQYAPEDALLLFDPKHGLGWDDPQGWEVYFGMTGTEMEMRLHIYQTLTAQLQEKDIEPELISVEYLHAPYYRMDR